MKGTCKRLKFTIQASASTIMADMFGYRRNMVTAGKSPSSVLKGA